MSNEKSSAANRFAKLGERLNDGGRLSSDRVKLDLSEKIFSAMQENQITEAELARRIGTTRAYVNKVLQGATNFTIESLVKIGTALDCTLSLEFKKNYASADKFRVTSKPSFDIPILKTVRSNIRDFAEYKKARTISLIGEEHSSSEAQNDSIEIAA